MKYKSDLIQKNMILTQVGLEVRSRLLVFQKILLQLPFRNCYDLPGNSVASNKFIMVLKSVVTHTASTLSKNRHIKVLEVRSSKNEIINEMFVSFFSINKKMFMLILLLVFNRLMKSSQCQRNVFL